MTHKELTKYSLFYLVYGREVVLLVQLKIPSLKLVENIEQEEPLTKKHFELNELEENNKKNLKNEIKNKRKIIKHFDQYAYDRDFNIGDKVWL